MITPSCLIDLKETLPKNAWHQVIPALRHNPLIWNALQNQDFRGRAISKFGGHPEKWSPAHLMLLSLKSELQPESLRATPLSTLDPELYLQALQVYEEHTSETDSELSLATSGLLALALSENFHQIKSWEWLPVTEKWSTALACLFGLVEQTLPLLMELSPQLAIDIILANPLQPFEINKQLSALLAASPTQKRLVLLRKLAHHRPDLSYQIACQVWNNQDIPSSQHSISHDKLIDLLENYEDAQNLISQLGKCLTQAEIHLAVGSSQPTNDSIQKSWLIVQQLQALIASQCTLTATNNEKFEQAQSDWNTSQTPPKFPIESTADLALAFLESGHTTEAKPLLATLEGEEHPVAWLALAVAAKQKGDSNAAREAALKVSAESSSLSLRQVLILGNLLLTLNQAAEATILLETTYQSYPNQINLIHLLAQTRSATGAYPQAIQAIHLAVALVPDRLDIHRDFAQIHELAGQWPAALQTRLSIVEWQNEPLLEDLHALAICALQLGQFKQAETACQEALALNPDDGLAHALLGETYLHFDKNKTAQEHLEKSILLASDQARPWLALARSQQKAGDSSGATETLRKATLAAPDQAEIHLALGIDYLQTGAISQALTSLRSAYQLADSYPPVIGFHLRGHIALPLAKTLFNLGHAEEALQIIQGNSFLPENQATLLHLKAQILLFLGQAQKAIPLLAKALLENPADVALNIDYARAQLESNNDPSLAIRALSTLLESDPQNAEALAWLAEAFKANDDPTNALDTYRKALSTHLGEDPDWYPKLSIGMAMSALALGQPETALAALQEAWQNAPQNLEILHTLAEAYTAAKLNEKALQTAITARSLAPLSLSNLTWFANLTAQIGAYDETTHALNCAIDLAPQDASLRLRLGEIYHQIGDLSAAIDSFNLIADLEQASPHELQTAAHYLKNLEHPEGALNCLEMAVRQCQEHYQSDICIGILGELIQTYRQLDMLDQALELLDDFSQQHPDEIMLIGQRAILLQSMDRVDEALKVLAKALSNNSDNQDLHLAAAQTHYSIGNLANAMEHTQRAIEIASLDDADGYPPMILAVAADIAAACLQDQIAQEIIDKPLGNEEKLLADLQSGLSYLCLRAELALQADEEIDAASALTSALKLAPNHSRVLALQARLTARHGDLDNAQHTLKNALSAWGQSSRMEGSSPVELLAISEAALELHQWSTAIFLLQEAAESYPQEPRVHLRLARGLVLRAEQQHLCQTLQVIRHAPGSASISDHAHKSFEQAVLISSKINEDIRSNSDQAEITYWRTRGQAVFQPSTEHTQALGRLPETPESRAALLASLRHNHEKHHGQEAILAYFADDSQLLAENTASLSGLMAQTALTLINHNNQLALNAAQSALDASIRYHHPNQPIFHTLLAYVAEKANDLETASRSIEIALTHWDDEPRWHAWAADIHLAAKDANPQVILDHLKSAVKLEPKNGKHHIKLGQAYLLMEDPNSAIPVLDHAAQLLTKQEAPWMELAMAHQACGDVAQTFLNAERAVDADPTNIEAHILLAETALNINNPEKTLQYCLAALEIDANHPRILLLQSRALDLLGEFEAALKAFDQALDSIPKSLPLLLELAQLTQKAAGNPQAIKALHEIAEDYPDDPRVMALLADILVDSDQTDPAIQAAQKALQTNQGDLDCSQESHLLLTLGRLMRRNGQLDHAIHHLSDAIQCNPEEIQAYMELGRTYQDRRQYSQALDVFQQAIAVAPADHQPYYQAGLTLKAIKDYTAAEDMLQRAAKLAPDDLSIRRQLGGLVALNLVHNRTEEIDLYVE